AAPKEDEGRQVRKYRFSERGFQGGTLPEDFENISGPVVGLICPFRVVSYSAPIVVDTTLGKTSLLYANFVGADVSNTRFHLERLRAYYSDQNPCTLLSWTVDPAIAIFNKILQEASPYYLDVVKDRRHMACGCANEEYLKSCAWTGGLNKQLREPLLDLAGKMVGDSNNLCEVLDMLR
ncbi:MAG: hypothetical protein WCI72_04950, partial [archaeon]